MKRFLSTFLLAVCTATATSVMAGIQTGPNAATSTQAHLGFVGTGTRINYEFNSGNSNFMERSYHIATTTITNIAVAVANFYAEEEAPGAPAYVTASVEYPSNNITRLAFGGNNYTNIPSGHYAMSDLANLSTPIPEGAMFWVRMFYFNTAGIIFHQSANTNYNEANFGGVSVTDLTGGGTIPPSYPYMMAPLAIIGETTKPSILMFGDSRLFGLGETTLGYLADPNPSFGGVGRLVDGANYGSANMGVPGDYYPAFLAADSQRLSLTNYATCVLSELGINDANAGELNIWTNLSNLATNLCRTLPVWGATLEPYTSSSDSWATLANQTFHGPGEEAAREAFNQQLRKHLVTGIRGYLEMAAPVESTTSNGFWVVTGGTGTAAVTTDGLHPNSLGCKIQAAAIPDYFMSGKAMTPTAGGSMIVVTNRLTY